MPAVDQGRFCCGFFFVGDCLRYQAFSILAADKTCRSKHHDRVIDLVLAQDQIRLEQFKLEPDSARLWPFNEIRILKRQSVGETLVSESVGVSAEFALPTPAAAAALSVWMLGDMYYF